MAELKGCVEDMEAAKKRIELEMERFKQCEKASKIKAFSREGLVQQVNRPQKISRQCSRVIVSP